MLQIPGTTPTISTIVCVLYHNYNLQVHDSSGKVSSDPKEFEGFFFYINMKYCVFNIYQYTNCDSSFLWTLRSAIRLTSLSMIQVLIISFILKYLKC